MKIVSRYCDECGVEYKLQLSGTPIEKSYATKDFCDKCGKLFHELFQEFKRKADHLFKPVWEKLDGDVFDKLLNYLTNIKQIEIINANKDNLLPPTQRVFASMYDEKKGHSRMDLVKFEDKLYKLTWWEKDGVKSDKEVWILNRKDIKNNKIVGHWNINKRYKENE
jgi:hypothetical protein